jgi:hypothetical protein
MEVSALLTTRFTPNGGRDALRDTAIPGRHDCRFPPYRHTVPRDSRD